MNRGKLLVFGILSVTMPWCTAQTAPQPNTPSAEPAIAQIRKCVTFIQLACRQGNQAFDVRGTGFFVGYPDSRLGADGSFVYLVTNRHVAECWNDSGVPMQVDRISIRLNRREAENGVVAQDVILNPSGNVAWIYPGDDSVDLAVLPLAPDARRFDFKMVPYSLLAGKNELAEQRITVGDPAFFAGFFYQFPGLTRMEPIVRQGIIAMMPQDKVPFVRKAMHVYLADLHAFGGNSGSPAFINLSGFHDSGLIVGGGYLLLGVVNGEVSEDENFNLELSTTLKGTGKANSGVSTIIPAGELKALLDDSRLQRMRDGVVLGYKKQ